jgi:hypothetical protein
MKRPRILRRHVGRPVDFAGVNAAEGQTLNGRIVSVRRGVAVVHYYVPGTPAPDGYTAYLLVRDPRIVAIY